mgnify:CR=1 FL=1
MSLIKVISSIVLCARYVFTVIIQNIMKNPIYKDTVIQLRAVHHIGAHLFSDYTLE